MRELTVRIRFTRPCLGNAKEARRGRFRLVRSPGGAVIFLASWHRSNMELAARILGRHQDEIARIVWDIEVDGTVDRDGWFQRYYRVGTRQRYSLHESFRTGQVVGINCAVPPAIGDDDFWQLMQLAGRYRGISPFKPGEYGFFEVVSVRPRRWGMARKETEPEPVATPDQAQSAGQV